MLTTICLRFGMYAMCNTSIKKIKVAFFFNIANVSTVNIKLQKYDGSGILDADANFTDVGTAWNVTTSAVTDGDQFSANPPDWDLSAGEYYILAAKVNTTSGGNSIIWFNGAIVLEEDWDEIINS